MLYTKQVWVYLLFISLCPLSPGYSQTSSAFNILISRYGDGKLEKAKSSLDQLAWKGDKTASKKLLDQFLNSGSYKEDVLILAQHLKISLDPSQKSQLISQINAEIASSSDQFKIRSLQHSLEAVQSGNPIEIYDGGGHYPMRILDVNQDGIADMILFVRVYFGPTPGYYMYALQDGKYQYLLDNSGDFMEILTNPEGMVFRYEIRVIDQAEPVIMENIVFNAKQKTFSLGPKLYYPSQIQIPKSFQEPVASQLLARSELRSAPLVDDTTKNPEEYSIEARTRCLRGNVVADLGLPSKVMVLAEEGDWALVAVSPEANIQETSMRHGMDDFHRVDGEYKTGRKTAPYLCGWIPQKDLKK